MAPTSGKKQPHLSYREHAKKVEGIVQARIQYFKRKNYCYTGWSMEKGWDKQIRKQEKIPIDLILKSGVAQDDDAHSSNNYNRKSMQDRLRAAADRLLSYQKESSQWTPKSDVPSKSQMIRFQNPTLKQPSKLMGMNSIILGQANWSPVRNMPQSVTESKTKGSRPGQKDMKMDDFPVIIKAGESKKKNGEKFEKEKENTAADGQVTEDVQPRSVDLETIRKELREKKVAFRAKLEHLKNVRTQGTAKNKTSTYIPVYQVSAIFHWKKMETTSGYPPLRLDQLLKCGYFSENNLGT